MTLLFVYGTLKHGYGNNYILENSKFVGEATSVDNFVMQTAGFPVLWPDPDQGAVVRGEVYDLDAPTLARCDRLEGHPRMYKREKREFIIGIARTGMRTCQAWVYIWQGSRDFGEFVKVNNKGVIDWQRNYNR